MKNICYVLILLAVIFSSFQKIKANAINENFKIEYVDLGLSVKWASCNVGATSPESCGNYYTWDEAKEWNLPTKAEQEELVDCCVWDHAILNGVAGVKITGTNGNSIFMPCAGYQDNLSNNSKISDGFYWSSILCSDDSNDAYHLAFCDAGCKGVYCSNRYDKLLVRCVAYKQ